MDLQLNKKKLECYRSLPTITEALEKQEDTVISDYCPDISRLIDWEENLFLDDYSVSDGKISVNGSIGVNIVYADEGGSVQSFGYRIPFHEILSSVILEKCEKIRLNGTIVSSEVQAVNPRKICTKVFFTINQTVYCADNLITVGEIEHYSTCEVETQCETNEILVIRSVQDKNFTVSSDIVLSGTKEPIEQLLSAQAEAIVTEAGIVGNKVMLKGIVSAHILYLTPSGTLASSNAELPFTQVADGYNGDNISADVFLTQQNVQWHPGGGNGDDMHCISIKLALNAFLVLHEACTICMIKDIYSVSHELNVKKCQCELALVPKKTQNEYAVHEVLNASGGVSGVLSASVRLGSASVVQNENGEALLHAQANVRILYYDDKNQLFALHKPVEMHSAVSMISGCTPSLQEISVQDIAATPVSGSIEVQFSVRFTLVSSCVQQTETLDSVSAEEIGRNGEISPSIILRPYQAEGGLWQLAKRYRTTVQDILQANDLSEEADVAADEMILIPRKRRML